MKELYQTYLQHNTKLKRTISRLQHNTVHYTKEPILKPAEEIVLIRSEM